MTSMEKNYIKKNTLKKFISERNFHRIKKSLVFITMNSLLMREVLDHGVDRKDFCDLVGLEVYVPTDEMYDLTEQAYTYSSTLYDIYGASDQFEKKADSFFKVCFIINLGRFKGGSRSTAKLPMEFSVNTILLL